MFVSALQFGYFACLLWKEIAADSQCVREGHVVLDCVVKFRCSQYFSKFILFLCEEL